MPPRLKVVTAGCKSNFADSSAIVRRALALGYALAAEGESADVVVVNGCTVTHRADRDSRSLARRARREHPGARIVVTGCIAARPPSAAPPLPEADLWLPPSGGRDLASFLAEGAPLPLPVGTLVPPSERTVFESDMLLGHRRTFLKVQDGCDSRCSYCAIPLARGRERSVPAAEVVEAARRAEEAGAREIVLTGIHVGRYGADRGEADGLPLLLAALLRGTREARFRLGSVEPLEVTERLVAAVAGSPRVCHHFHVPLQSGSDAVLRRMGRPYAAGRFLEVAALLRRSLPAVRIGADVIAGFPGETDRDFRDTLELVSGGAVDYLHAFPYSAREGTPAALFPDQVPPAERKRRVALLLEADREARRRDMESRAGCAEVMIAERFDPATGRLRGTTGSYHAVEAPGRGDEAGRLLPVLLRSPSARAFRAERLP